MIHLDNNLEIEKGCFHAYFIFDVADTIELAKLRAIETGKFKEEQLELRSTASPNYIHFVVPPLVAVLPDVEIDGHSANVRLKIYDYGTVAIRLSFPFTGKWNDFAATTRSLRQSDKLRPKADSLLSDVQQMIGVAMNRPHVPLVEDYFIFEVQSLAPKINASALLAEYRADLAALLLCESKPLTEQEQDESLRINFTYFETDLVVVQWDAALVFENAESAEAVESILEFANTQLVELRTYDARLDGQLDEIYRSKLTRKSSNNIMFGYHASFHRAEQLQRLVVDIRELSDRSSNSLKIIGDAFYARLYRGIATRLGLSDWDQQIESKLRTVDEIYRFTTDQSQHARSELLELIIIILIVVEIILSLLR
jgi:hypothetical protein